MPTIGSLPQPAAILLHGRSTTLGRISMASTRNAGVSLPRVAVRSSVEVEQRRLRDRYSSARCHLSQRCPFRVVESCLRLPWSTYHRSSPWPICPIILPDVLRHIGRSGDFAVDERTKYLWYVVGTHRSAERGKGPSTSRSQLCVPRSRSGPGLWCSERVATQLNQSPTGARNATVGTQRRTLTRAGSRHLEGCVRRQPGVRER